MAKNKNIRKFAKTGLVAFGATMFAGVGLLAGCETKLPGSDAKWYSGTETPTIDTVGDVGDFYYDTDDCVIYQKTDDGWVFVSCIKGEQGIQGEVGAKWFSGAGEPTDPAVAQIIANARVGDFYIDILTNKIHRKGDNVWSHITTIQNGQDGTDGEDGSNGTDGEDGKDGATWFTGTAATGEGEFEVAGAKVGDLYLNTETFDIYKCTAENTWEKLGNIKGADGLDGNDGTNGEDGTDGENGTNGEDGTDGEDGVDGTSFRSDFGAPAEDLGIVGDTYLDLITKDLYKKTESGWEKVGSIAAGTEASPVMISSADDFMNITSYAEGTYFKLNADVDLSEHELLGTDESIFTRFNGTIDGDGHTIYMPSNNENLGDGEHFIFEDLNGLMKNIVLDYGDSVVDRYMMLAHSSKHEIRFENVTIAEGKVYVSTSYADTNFSPFVGRIYNGVSFVNCTNNLDISGVKYGSAFVGGYIRQNDRSVTNYDGTERSGTEGFMKDVKVEFINCENNGDLNMTHASMLWGNHTILPLKENLIVQDCVNNGKIVGTQDAELFCGLINDGGHFNTDHKNGLMDLNQTIESLITNEGSCFVDSLDGLALSMDENKNMLLTVPEWDNHTYKLSLNCLMYAENGGTMQFTASFDITKASLVEMGEDELSGKIANFRRWQFIGKSYAETLGEGYVKTELTNCVYSAEALACGVKLYLYYNETEDKGYYCFETEGTASQNYSTYMNGVSTPIYRDIEITAYNNEEGKAVGQAMIHRSQK